MRKGVESLGRLPLFAELDAEDVASLDARCVWRKVKAGDLVIEECARDNDVSFVVSGHARVLPGDKRTRGHPDGHSRRRVFRRARRH